jgi:hypothetical protein
VSFRTEGALVHLRLPPRDKVAVEATERADATCSSWMSVPIGPLAPLSFEIHAVAVELAPDAPIDYPVGFVNETLPTDDRFRLHDVGQQFISQSERALETFFQVARWQSRRCGIGRAARERTSVGIELVERADATRLYKDGGTAHASPRQVLNVEAWEEAVRALRDGVRPPIYWDLLLEAEWQLKLGDLRRTVADTAMACELFIQTKVSRSLPRKIRSSVRALVERTNAGSMRDKLFGDTLTLSQQADWPELRKKIQQIADRRNVLLHRGSLQGVTVRQLEADVAYAKALLSFD